jgi:hypothetical protein
MATLAAGRSADSSDAKRCAFLRTPRRHEALGSRCGATQNSVVAGRIARKALELLGIMGNTPVHVQRLGACRDDRARESNWPGRRRGSVGACVETVAEALIKQRPPRRAGLRRLDMLCYISHDVSGEGAPGRHDSRAVRGGAAESLKERRWNFPGAWLEGGVCSVSSHPMPANRWGRSDKQDCRHRALRCA